MKKGEKGINRRVAAAVAVLLPCLAFMLVVAVTDRMFWGRTPTEGKDRRAAVAIRDNVTAFQKWGSKAFTWPYLCKHYDAAWYFTQTDFEDQKQPFLSCLAAALAQYQHVDLFLLAHSNNFIEWVAELEPELRSRVRLVYNTGCAEADQAPRWLELGVRTYVGHSGKSESPIFYFYFLRRWTRGYTVEEAVDEANEATRLLLVRVEPFFLGKLDATQLGQQSQATCFGDAHLSLARHLE